MYSTAFFDCHDSVLHVKLMTWSTESVPQTHTHTCFDELLIDFSSNLMCNSNKKSSISSTTGITIIINTSTSSLLIHMPSLQMRSFSCPRSCQARGHWVFVGTVELISICVLYRFVAIQASGRLHPYFANINNRNSSSTRNGTGIQLSLKVFLIKRRLYWFQRVRAV